MHRGENFHRLLARIRADKFLVNLEDAFEFAVEHLARKMREVEIDGVHSREAEFFLEDNFVDGARGDVARDQVAVFWVPLLEEIKTFLLRNRTSGARVTGFSRHPDAAAFAAQRFAHQAAFVFAGNRGGMNLDEFAIRVISALLEKSRLGSSCADD